MASTTQSAAESLASHYLDAAAGLSPKQRGKMLAERGKPSRRVSSQQIRDEAYKIFLPGDFDAGVEENITRAIEMARRQGRLKEGGV